MGRQERDLEKWLGANAGDRPPAVILGTSWNALSFARSLGRRRVPVLMLDSSRSKLGSYTRYGRVIVLPHVDDDPEEWIRILRFVGARLAAPAVLLPMGDAHSLLISRHEQALSAGFRFVAQPLRTVEQIVNKRQQYAVAREAGIPIPATHFPESAEEVRELSAHMPFPCLLKPYTSHIARRAVGQKLLVARSTRELVSGYELLASRDVPAMVQEIVPGEDSALFGYHGLWDRNGRELAWLTKRKLRQHPPGFGDGSIHVTVEAPAVADLSRRLLRAFDYCGFVCTEFKLDVTSGTYYLMEINPRSPAGNQMAIDGGLDFPWIGYRYLTGSDGDAEPAQGFLPGVKLVNEELEAHTYLERRRSEGMTIRRWARPIRGATSTAVWARDDPLPFVVLTWRLVKRAITSVTDRSPAARGFRRRVRSAWPRASATSAGTPR